MNDRVMFGAAQATGFVTAFQSSLLFLNRESSSPLPAAYSAKVVKVYTDRGTVDLSTTVERFPNVPLLLKVGMDPDGNVWGEVEFPAENDYVLVQPLDKFNQKKIVIGSFIPYLMKEFGDSQVAVNSDNKLHTLKLIEVGLEKVWRRIFQSGTTAECKADGTYVIETPSGSLFLIDETNGVIKIEQRVDGEVENSIVMGPDSVIINNNLEVLK